MKKLLLAIGMLILIGAEILRVYFIMPFPGSQQSNNIDVAYFLNNYIWYIRLLAILLIVYSLYGRFRGWRKWQQALLVLVLIFYGCIFYMFNFKFLADKMFYQPVNKSFQAAATNAVKPEKLVIATVINGEAKAYPIEIIGYHHQVQDTVGGEPIIVTYCTVCRTGRIYSPVINGKKEQFRLVGMDHFNAMFEDRATKSWWAQESGKAITGPLKGTALREIPSSQMRLSSWIDKYPETQILQPDTLFKKQYAGLAGFDNGTIDGGLEKRDSASWKMKSWVVGIQYMEKARAYDWNELIKHRVINDSFPGLPVALVIEPDSVTFHAFRRDVYQGTVYLTMDPATLLMVDTNTKSTWNYSGVCIDGPLKGTALPPVQAYQEFWHSWQWFHPLTEKWMMK
jgi:Protein of unknown function (DUF3179)